MWYSFLLTWTSHKQKNKITRWGLCLGEESNYQLSTKNKPQKSMGRTSIKAHCEVRNCKELKHKIVKVSSLAPKSLVLRLLFFFFFWLFRATPTAHGGSQARGLISCGQWPTPESQQQGIRASSSTYTTGHSNAGSSTHWARPGIESETSWFLVGFVNHRATTGTPSQ